MCRIDNWGQVHRGSIKGTTNEESLKYSVNPNKVRRQNKVAEYGDNRKLVYSKSGNQGFRNH